MMALSAGGCWGSWHPFQPRWWGPAMALMPRMVFLLRYSLGSKGSSQCASQCVLILTWIYGSQKKIKSLEEDFTSRPIYFINFIIVNLLSLCSCCLNKTNDHRWVSTDSFSWTRRTAALEMLGQIPLLQTSFVALSRKTEPISASQALWESFFLPIMAVALFNPHCMQSITGGPWHFQLSNSCGKHHVWNNLLRVVPVQREWGPFTPESQAAFTCHVPSGLVIETCSKKNLRVWLSIPIKKRWAKWKQLIQVLWARVLLLHGKYMVVPFKLVVPWKYCGVSQEQCSSQVDQTSGKAEIKHNFSCIDIMHIAVSVHQSTIAQKKKKRLESKLHKWSMMLITVLSEGDNSNARESKYLLALRSILLSVWKINTFI